MPSKRRGNDLVLFSSKDPQPLVSWLVETFGLQTILKSLSEQRPGGMSAPAKRASKKGGKRGRPKGSKNGSKKGTKKGGKRGAKAQGNEKGNG